MCSASELEALSPQVTGGKALEERSGWNMGVNIETWLWRALYSSTVATYGILLPSGVLELVA